MVDDLNEIVVDILLVDEVDVTAFPVVPLQDLDVIFLYSGGLGYNIIVLVGNALVEEVLPFVVSETVVVQLLQTCAEIGYGVRLRMDRQILIALLPKEPDEPFSSSSSLWYASDVLTACSYSETTVYSALSAMILYWDIGYYLFSSLNLKSFSTSPLYLNHNVPWTGWSKCFSSRARADKDVVCPL